MLPMPCVLYALVFFKGSGTAASGDSSRQSNAYFVIFAICPGKSSAETITFGLPLAACVVV